MPSRPDRLLLQPRLLMISVAVLLAAGFGLTLLIFYPGVITYDARFVYEDIAKGTMGDWQSPVMVWLWALIDPIAPGAGSMFLLFATTYWLGFGVLSLALVGGVGVEVQRDSDAGVAEALAHLFDRLAVLDA